MEIGREEIKKSMKITKVGGREEWHWITHRTSGYNPFHVETTHHFNVLTDEAVTRKVGELFQQPHGRTKKDECL